MEIGFKGAILLNHYKKYVSPAVIQADLAEAKELGHELIEEKKTDCVAAYDFTRKKDEDAGIVLLTGNDARPVSLLNKMKEVKFDFFDPSKQDYDSDKEGLSKIPEDDAENFRDIREEMYDTKDTLYNQFLAMGYIKALHSKDKLSDLTPMIVTYPDNPDQVQ